MKVLVITVKEFARTARRIVGPDADVLPVGGVLIWPQAARYDLVLLFLHPRADGLAWVDDAGRDVLTVEDVRGLPLDGAVVFVGACYGSENRALLDALWDAGAQAVIHGPGVNYGGRDGALSGADILASGLVSGMRMGLPIRLAWSVARTLGSVANVRGLPGAKDAMEYVLDGAEGTGASARWGAILTGIVTLLVLFISIFSGGGQGGLLTTFSSIPAPPAGVTWWQKDLYRGADLLNWVTPVPITGTNTILIVDTITASAGITFTLVESWDTAAITLTSVVTTGGGTLAQSSGMVTWSVSSALTTPYTLDKRWSTQSGSWDETTLTETLTTSGGAQVVYIEFEHASWSPTPVPTWTPWYTPIPWDETPYPTSTPCAGIGCVPYDDLPGIEYYLWLPLVLRDYGDGMSYGGPAPIP